MERFKNLKLKKKLIFTFAFIGFFCLTMGIIGITSLYSINKNYAQKITIVNDITLKSNLIQSDISKIVYLKSDLLIFSYDKKEYSETKNKISDLISSIHENIKQCKEILGSNAGEPINILQTNLDNYIKSLDALISTIDSGNLDEALKMLPSLEEMSHDLIVNTQQVFDNSQNFLKSTIDLTSINSKVKLVILSVLIILSFLSLACTGILLSKTLRKPLQEIENVAVKIANGDFNSKVNFDREDEIGQLSKSFANVVDIFNMLLNDINNMTKEIDEGNTEVRIDTSKYNGCYKQAVESINRAVGNLLNDTNKIIKCMESYGSGNFSYKIEKFPGKKAVINESADNLKQKIEYIINDIDLLLTAAINGNLSEKMKTEHYTGDWQKIPYDINKLLDSFVEPINEILEVLDLMAQGNLSVKVKGEYKGDFNKIKNSLNNTLYHTHSYVSEISDLLTKIANQNLDISINRTYLGDFKEIHNSLTLIIDRFNVLIGEINTSARQVASASKQISQSNIDLAQGSSEQASAVEELNSTVEEIVKKSIENARKSEQANKIALSAKQNAFVGSNEMNNMLNAMNDINESSTSISDIIKVIDDIAFQTNILALNAAVEAARAGIHGKGFAVVADEVRTLAGKSQEAAQKTTSLIEKSISKISIGSKIANNTSATLNAMVEQVQEISELVSSCAVASKETEESLNQISIGISQISDATQNNTSLIEESALASEDMSHKADVFNNIVSQFKLRETFEGTLNNNENQSFLIRGNINKEIENSNEQQNKIQIKSIDSKDNTKPKNLNLYYNKENDQNIKMKLNKDKKNTNIYNAKLSEEKNIRHNTKANSDEINFDMIKDFGKY